MRFIDDLDCSVLKSEFEHSDQVPFDKLCRNRTADQPGKLLFTADDILSGLYR